MKTVTQQMYGGSNLRPDQIARLQGMGANPLVLGLGGAVLALGIFEGYCLYKVWKSRSGQKTWPWWVLGAGLGAQIVGLTIAGGLGTAAGALMGDR